MKLRRVRIAGFRRLVEPLEVAALEDGLTVLGGDNELGKSTWLEAVRTALFDRHTLTGKAADSLLPDGQRVAPEITLDFDTATGGWTLFKRFCQKPAAELTGPGGERHAGDAAEDRLQELLGFERPGRGASEPRHHGPYGLLWLTQGTAHLDTRPAEGARRALGGALEAEVGDVLGGGLGQQLLDDLASDRDRFWTRTGKPARSLRQAMETVQRLEAEQTEAQTALDGYRRSVDELARIEQAHRRLLDAGELQRQTRRRDEARQAHERLIEARRRRDQAISDCRVAEAEREAARSRWSERRRLVKESERAVEATAATADRNALRDDLQRRQSCLETLRRRLDEQPHPCGQPEAAVAARDRQRRHQAASEQRDRLRQTLERARGAHERRRAALREAAAMPATAEAVRGLRAVVKALDRTEARLAAGATWLRADVNVPVRTSGAARETGQGYQITGEARFELDGVGTLTVTAGGQDLPQAQTEREQRLADRDRQLAALGVRDLHEAEAQLEARRTIEGRAAEAGALLEALAPDGLPALAAAYDETETALQGLGLETPDPAASGDPEAELERLRRAVADHERDLDTERQALAALREHIVAEDSRAHALQAEAKRLDEHLRRLRGEVADDPLHAAALDAERRLTAAEEVRREAEGGVAGLNPDRIELELESAESAVRHTAEDLQALEAQRTEMRTRLDALGHDGLSERAETLQAEHARAARQCDALQREADAVWHAWAALDAAARQARETFLAPLTERLRPYLELFLPAAELALDDELTLTGLRRDGRVEPFAQLSVGTREQLAIVARLAFADLLAEHGEPVPVIFDDALVFADEHRFHCMQLVLRLAARRHQVLILTCRPNDYRDLGAPIRWLGAEPHYRTTA